MNFGLANYPTETTRITHRNASSPDVAAYRAPHISHWTSTPYMDSGHCLISCLVKMVDGIPRLANTLPRREKATFALRKADWPAFLHRCVKLSLPPRPHGWTSAEVSCEQLSAISRAAAVKAPKRCGHTKWNRPRSLMKQHTKHTHCLTRRQPASSRIYLKKRGLKSSLAPWLRYASGSLCEKTWGLTQPELAISSRRGGAAPSSSGIGCAPHLSWPRMRPASATGKSACPSFCAAFTCHVTLYCC
ncbi:hypothetical protein TcG_09666, partial [Trypanosoma cruzi]